MKSWLRTLLPIAVAATSLVAADTTGLNLNDGQSLATFMCAQKPVLEAEGMLKIDPDNGKLKEVPVRLRFQDAGARWRTIYETKPKPGETGERLVVTHQEEGPNSYSLLKGGTGDEAAVLKAGDAFKPFAGSDFWLADLGLEFFHWPSQKLVKKEMRRSRFCHVLESTNPNPTPDGYSRVLSWIDTETGSLIRAEAYDVNGKRYKDFSISKVAKVNNRWQLKEMKIYNRRTDSTTTLEFDLEVP